MEIGMRWDFRWSILLLSFFVLGCEAKSCKKKSSCSCQSDEGIMDLKPSAIKGIKFQDIPGSDGKIYSYNPCYSFDETDQSAPPNPDACKSVAACQIVSNTPNEYYDIGTQSSASFSYIDSNTIGLPNLGEVLTVQYVAGDNARKSIVILKCDQQEEYYPLGEIPMSSPPTYILYLSSPDVCFRSVGLSVGTILIIVFFGIVAVYLMGGVLFNKIYKKENGVVNVIPQGQLWVSFPGLVKDGVLFIFRRGQYQPIKG